MMVLVSRLLVGAVALLFLWIGLGMWFNVDAAAAGLGLSGLGAVGKATVRADIGGFFATGGGIALAAAIRLRSDWLWPLMLLLGAALTGRLITVAMEGLPPGGIPPMAVEAVTIALLLLARRIWPRG